MEDKLVRAASSSEDTLALAAQVAVKANDVKAFEKICGQIGEMYATAAAAKNKSLMNRVSALHKRVEAIARNPAGTHFLETKTLARKRAAVEDSADALDASAMSEPIGTITGYGAVFGNRDLGGDIIERGAFAASLARWKADGRQPVLLAQHDSGVFPIGVWTSLSEDSYGLRVEGSIANTPRGREAWALINMQPSALDGMSIGYRTVQDRYDQSRDARVISEIELWEISIVSLPMNTAARIDTRKASSAVAVMSLDRALSDLRRAIADEEAGADRGHNVITFPKAAPQRGDVSDDDEEAIAAMLNSLAHSLRKSL